MSIEQKIAVAAFGFGEPSSVNPNPKIASMAADLGRACNAVAIFTDRDVSPHLSRGEITVEEIDPIRIPTTYRLAVLAIEGAKKYKLNELKVVAARCHMRRCLRDLRWAALDCSVAVKLTPRPIRGKQYDSAAATPYTRAAWRWWPFEVAYRLVSTLFHGWYKRTRA